MSHELRYRNSGLNPAEGAAAMIDRQDGHLALDGRDHAIQLLDGFNAAEFEPWTLADAWWTPYQPERVNGDNRNSAQAG